MRKDSNLRMTEQLFYTKVCDIALDYTSFYGFKKSSIVHQLATGKVDESRPLLHETKSSLIKSSACIISQGHMDSYVVALFKDFLNVCYPLDMTRDIPSCFNGYIRIIT